MIKGQAYEIPFSGSTCFTHVREIADIFVNTSRAVNVPGGAAVYTIGGDSADVQEWITIVGEDCVTSWAACLSPSMHDKHEAERVTTCDGFE